MGEQDNGAGGGGDAGGVQPGGASISDILAFDPFQSNSDGSVTPKKDAKAPTVEDGSEGTVPEVQPQKTRKQEAAPAKPAAAQPAVPEKPAAPTMPATPPAPDLSAQVAGMRAALEQVIQRPPEAKPAEAQPEKPRYNFQLPNEAVNALTSEDPNVRGQALNGLVNGLANALWKDFSQHVTESFSKFDVSSMMERHLQMRDVQRQTAEDMYGAHPNLLPVASIVQQEAMELAQTYMRAGHVPTWTPEFRDAVAERVYTKLPQLRSQGGTSPQPKPKANGKQPFVAGGGARPADPNPSGGVPDFMDALGMKM